MKVLKMLEGLKPWFNSILRPLARGLIATGLKPNQVTLAGLFLFGVAGWLCLQGSWRSALVVVIAGSLMDGLDGLLARESGRKTTFGAILDSSCDRLTEMFLLFGILVHYYRHGDGATGVFLSYAALAGSVMVSYVKARCEGVGVPCAGGILQRPERLILLSAGLLAGPSVMMWILGLIAAFSSFTVVQRLIIAAKYCRTHPPSGN
jgi:CDP-diacylglycerol---glycerol-3-phosphate 3-phosphatidyltransferase